MNSCQCEDKETREKIVTHSRRMRCISADFLPQYHSRTAGAMVAMYTMLCNTIFGMNMVHASSDCPDAQPKICASAWSELNGDVPAISRQTGFRRTPVAIVVPT